MKEDSPDKKEEPSDNIQQDNSVNKFLTRQSKQTRLILLVSVIGLLTFTLIATTSPFKDKLFQALYPKEESYINIEAFISSMTFNDQEKDLLFTQYYGVLGTSTNLRLGSGLEGYLIKTVATIMNIPFYVKLIEQPKGVIIGIKLDKTPK